MLRFCNLVVRDAPLECPFCPANKCVSFAAAAPIIGDAMSLFGNMYTTSQTNDTNYDIARMNMKAQQKINESNEWIAEQANKYNYKMFQEQNAWNELMWNKANEYNSPEHMVELYKKAGLNPAMLAGQFNAAGGLQSAQAQPYEKAHLVAPQMDFQALKPDLSGFGSGIGGAVNAYYQAKLMDAQRKKTDNESSGINIQNQQFMREAPYRLKKLQEDAKKEGVLGDIARSELNFQLKSFDTRLNLLYGDAAIQEKTQKMMVEQLNGQILDNQMKKIMNAFQPQWNDMQLRQASLGLQQIRANIGLINANTLLTIAQKESEIEKKVGYVIDNEMKGIDKATKEEMKPLIIQSAREDLYSKEDARYMAPIDFFGRHNASNKILLPGASSAAADLIERNYKRDSFGKRLYNSNWRPHSNH